MRLRSWQPGEESELWALTRQQPYAAYAEENDDRAQWSASLRANPPFIVEYDHQVIGYADLGRAGEIGHFYVHADWHGRGIGSLLMNKLHEKAQAQGLAGLRAHVAPDARAFFEYWGFTAVSTSEHGALMHKHLAG